MNFVDTRTHTHYCWDHNSTIIIDGKKVTQSNISEFPYLVRLASHQTHHKMTGSAFPVSANFQRDITGLVNFAERFKSPTSSKPTKSESRVSLVEENGNKVLMMNGVVIDKCHSRDISASKRIDEQFQTLTSVRTSSISISIKGDKSIQENSKSIYDHKTLSSIDLTTGSATNICVQNVAGKHFVDVTVSETTSVIQPKLVSEGLKSDDLKKLREAQSVYNPVLPLTQTAQPLVKKETKAIVITSPTFWDWIFNLFSYINIFKRAVPSA